MYFDLLILGIVIGSNNLAAALALGALGAAPYRARIAMVFGIFEFLIPLVGIWIGNRASILIESHVTWLGPSILIALGIWTIISGVRNRQQDENLLDLVTSWRGISAMAAGLSMDNLIAGFSLGLAKANPFAVASAIAAFSVAFTLIGISLGKKSRRGYERPAKIMAGILLIGLGIANALGWI